LEESDRLAYGAVLLRMIVEPVLSAPAIFIGRLLSRPCIPVRPLPTRRLPEACPGRGNPVMQDAALHPARRAPLPKRPGILVADDESLDHPVAEVAGIVLPGM